MSGLHPCHFGRSGGSWVAHGERCGPLPALQSRFPGARDCSPCLGPRRDGHFAAMHGTVRERNTFIEYVEAEDRGPVLARSHSDPSLGSSECVSSSSAGSSHGVHSGPRLGPSSCWTGAGRISAQQMAQQLDPQAITHWAAPDSSSVDGSGSSGNSMPMAAVAGPPIRGSGSCSSAARGNRSADEVLQIPVDAQGRLLSVGSIPHATKTCKPCARFEVSRCDKGAMCDLCHYPHPAASKRPVKPCKVQRDKYRRLVTALARKIEADHVNFDLETATLPNYVRTNPALYRKLSARVSEFCKIVAEEGRLPLELLEEGPAFGDEDTLPPASSPPPSAARPPATSARGQFKMSL